VSERLDPDSIEATAFWKEYDFVSSLIPMYRGFELHAMQLGIAIFTAAAGFAAAALDKGNWELVYFVGALLPWPLTLVLLVVATMEIRLVRASRWIKRELAPRVMWHTGSDEDEKVLQWEAEPNRFLDGSLAKFKPLTGAWTYAVVIGGPGLLGGGTGLVGGFVNNKHGASLLWISIPGLLLLVAAAVLVSWISSAHEQRRAEATPRARTTAFGGGPFGGSAPAGSSGEA
jgi:hypothetical protein